MFSSLQFNWKRYLKGIFTNVNISITETEDIVVYAPRYLSDMAYIVQRTDNR